MGGTKSLSHENPQRVASEIADILGEKLHGPRKLVRNVVEHCGVEFARQLVQDTNEVMSAGGMLTAAGDRLRTKGGVFFYLARGRMSDELRQTIFPPHTTRGQGSSSPQAPVFSWPDRLQLIPTLLENKGEVRSVKITLIGHPGKTETRGDLVITSMSHSAGTPTFPRGVPQPPDTPTVYTVYIGAKQWKQVASALDDPEDMLIIEGMCAFDPEIEAIAIYTTKVTSKELEARKRGPKPNGQTSNQAADPVPAEEKASGSARVPANIAKKLHDLHAAADLYRQKIATIQSKPADQQFGLEMTQKLLHDVQEKITALEKEYV